MNTNESTITTRVFHRAYGLGRVLSTDPRRPEGDALLVQWDNPVQAQSDQDWVSPSQIERF